METQPNSAPVPAAGESSPFAKRIDRLLCSFLRHWMLFFLGPMVIFVTLPFLAPVAMHWGWEGLGTALYVIYSPFCHQLPQRSFFFFGEKLTYTLPEILAVYPHNDPWLLRHFAGRLPMLGVCLGHQAIGAAFGGRIVRARELMHGKTSLIHHTGKGVFEGLPDPFTVIRYHSLAIERAGLPDCLEVTAETADGEIMGVRHRSLPIEGVQFHPESILTEHGHALLRNFLRR